MRLIDADNITDFDIADYLGGLHRSSVPDVRNMLNDRPTVYDPEKIVEKLSNSFRIVQTDEDLEWNRAIDRAISIVKGGGVNE